MSRRIHVVCAWQSATGSGFASMTYNLMGKFDEAEMDRVRKDFQEDRGCVGVTILNWQFLEA